MSRVGLDGKALPSHLRLRALKVSQCTLTRYLNQIREFEEWAKSKKSKITEQNLDMRVTQYLTQLFDTDAEMSKASYLIYGLQLLHCKVDKNAFLVSAKQALSGWRKRDPGQMRVPVPEEFLHDLMHLAIQDERLDVAMAMLIQYDGYLRPSKASP